MVKTPIYMDYHATTPIDQRVTDVMLPYFSNCFGNAASRNHTFGWEAEEAVENSRKSIAQAMGARTSEIIFTSGATESNNLVLLGACSMYAQKGNHIITAKTEHKAILDTCEFLESSGVEVTYLPVGEDGLIDLNQLADAMRENTILVSIMAANNEIGVLQPISEIGAMCHEKGILFHTDAAQALGKMPMHVEEMNIDLLSFSGHKIYGPKGIGGLYVRKRKPRVKLSPILHGGGHERGMRSGTLNVPGIVGLAKALEICMDEMEEENKRIGSLRDRLEKTLLTEIDFSYLNGHKERRLIGNSNISFNYVEGEGLMMAIPDIAVSSGSACTSASLEPSYVLKAIGRSDELAHSSIRFGLGRFTTEEEVDYVIEKMIAGVKKLRDLSPLYEMVLEGVDLATVEWAEH
ncbi:IscS subfamily cysteine desulfurase [bacterium]|jgi:cysteine desulfurase|nr:IscS subfamily cysteine desulfurase [bacterium]